MIAKPENHPGSLGLVRAGISEEKGKPTLRLNQARLKDFRCSFGQCANVEMRAQPDRSGRVEMTVARSPRDQPTDTIEKLIMNTLVRPA
jgi:hypothetical protein